MSWSQFSSGFLISNAKAKIKFFWQTVREHRLNHKEFWTPESKTQYFAIHSIVNQKRLWFTATKTADVGIQITEQTEQHNRFVQKNASTTVEFAASIDRSLQNWIKLKQLLKDLDKKIALQD